MAVSIITLAIALVTAGIAWRTFLIQERMDRRDLEYRKDKARLAVDIIWRKLHIVVTSLAGAMPDNVLDLYGPRWDVLEAVESHFGELTWIPECQWKRTFVDLMNHALPKGSMGSAATLEQNLERLRLTYNKLHPAGQLYKDCMAAIDGMT